MRVRACETRRGGEGALISTFVWGGGGFLWFWFFPGFGLVWFRAWWGQNDAMRFLSFFFFINLS